MKSGFCACAITFQLASTSTPIVHRPLPFKHPSASTYVKSIISSCTPGQVPCRRADLLSAASRSKGPVSITVDFIWDLWLKNWHRDPNFALRISLSLSSKGMAINTVAMYYRNRHLPSFHLVFTSNFKHPRPDVLNNLLISFYCRP
jgi:hypothetical protein